MCTTIGSNSSYVYEKEQTKPTTETQKANNEDKEVSNNKDTEKSKAFQVSEKNEIKSLKSADSSPVSKMLDFGAFDYKRASANKSVEESKDFSAVKKDLGPVKEAKNVLKSFMDNSDLRDALRKLVDAHGDMAESFMNMGPEFTSVAKYMRNQEGTISTEFFEALKKIITAK